MTIIGLHISGPKSGKTTAVKMKSTKGEKRSYVLSVELAIVGSEGESDDLALMEYLDESCAQENPLICVDVATSDPPLFGVNGIKADLRESRVEEAQWMVDYYHDSLKVFPKLKYPCVYIQRPSDLFLRVEYGMDGNEPLSSNHAPRWIRWKMIQKSLQHKIKVVETLPRYTVKSFSKILGALSTDIEDVRNIHMQGRKARAAVVEKLQKKGIIFIKDDDIDFLVDHVEVFDAFLSGIVGKCYEENLTLDCPKKILQDSWPALVDATKTFKFFKK